MPEGPDLAIAASFILRICNGKTFSRIAKSAVSKSSDIPWKDGDNFTLTARSRGKELMLTIEPITPDIIARKYILFHFGMSGRFAYSSVDSLPKHSHLMFFTSDNADALAFVDTRRFGKWSLKETPDEWSMDRGPCPVTEYELFRENIVASLDDSVFNRPLCEAMLDQRFFNGIGNYLRAEIIYRIGVPPFEKARTILESIAVKNQDFSNEKEQDILSLCKTIPEEAIALQETHYASSSNNYYSDNYKEFEQWVRCYMKPNMKSTKDSNGRTIWFAGPAGPMEKRSGERKVTGKRATTKMSNGGLLEIEEKETEDKNVQGEKQSQKKTPGKGGNSKRTGRIINQSNQRMAKEENEQEEKHEQSLKVTGKRTRAIINANSDALSKLNASPNSVQRQSERIRTRNRSKLTKLDGQA